MKHEFQQNTETLTQITCFDLYIDTKPSLYAHGIVHIFHNLRIAGIKCERRNCPYLNCIINCYLLWMVWKRQIFQVIKLTASNSHTAHCKPIYSWIAIVRNWFYFRSCVHFSSVIKVSCFLKDKYGSLTNFTKNNSQSRERKEGLSNFWGRDV